MKKSKLWICLKVNKLSYLYACYCVVWLDKEGCFCCGVNLNFDLCLKCCRWLCCSSCSGFGCLGWEEVAQKSRLEVELVEGMNEVCLGARLILLLGGIMETRTALITHQTIHLRLLSPPTILGDKLRRILRGNIHGLLITTVPSMRFDHTCFVYLLRLLCSFEPWFVNFFIGVLLTSFSYRLLLLFHMPVWSPRISLLV